MLSLTRFTELAHSLERYLDMIHVWSITNSWFPIALRLPIPMVHFISLTTCEVDNIHSCGDWFCRRPTTIALESLCLYAAIGAFKIPSVCGILDLSNIGPFYQRSGNLHSSSLPQESRHKRQILLLAIHALQQEQCRRRNVQRMENKPGSPMYLLPFDKKSLIFRPPLSLIVYLKY